MWSVSHLAFPWGLRPADFMGFFGTTEQLAEKLKL
jgi:hypothetical protein